MLKNEEKRLHVSLNSVIGHIDSMVIYDTGSTDSTVSIVKEFAAKHSLPLHLKEGEFVDFSVSRNISLDFADTFPDIDYYLLLDCNDELRGGEHLRKIAEFKPEITAWLVGQHWLTQTIMKYYNFRFVKARGDWRYKGVVHEAMYSASGKPASRLPEEIYLYQDRTLDDDKTKNRFARDKRMLIAEYEKDPTSTRTIFYLAQTYLCLKEFEDSFYFYKLRASIPTGLPEEIFLSYQKLAEMAAQFRHDWHDVMKWCMKAYEHTARAEPLIVMANHYVEKENWTLAYTFSELACKLRFPTTANLWVDKKVYDYTRWHVMGISGYWVGHFSEGKHGCMKALEASPTNESREKDKANLQFYLNKEKEMLIEEKREAREDELAKRKARRDRRKK